jgi:hypothetical protein
VPGLILAAVIPDNTPNGYYLTFLFPMLLFIVIGGVLYLLFSRPHRRIPARGLGLPRSAAAPSGPYTAATSGATAVGATATTAAAEDTDGGGAGSAADESADGAPGGAAEETATDSQERGEETE